MGMGIIHSEHKKKLNHVFCRTLYEKYYIKEVQECLCKLQMWVAPIRLETGRYDGMEEKDRICLLCDHNIIESEYHVVMSCPVYNELRGEFSIMQLSLNLILITYKLC